MGFLVILAKYLRISFLQNTYAKFPQSFGEIVWNFAETVGFHKFPFQEIRWNFCILCGDNSCKRNMGAVNKFNNPIFDDGLFLYPPKTWEIQRCSDVFKEHRKV